MTPIQFEAQERLRGLMERAKLTSWRSLSRAAGVSIGQIQKLRRGQIERLTLATIDRLAAALGCARGEFLALFEMVETFDPEVELNVESTPTQHHPDRAAVVQAECDRLREELARQANDLGQAFQAQAIDQLESFLTFWPVAVDHARRDPSLPAIKLVPLLKPIELLLASWNVKPIGVIGEVTLFDPSQHQPNQINQINQPIEDQLHSGDHVRVTHCGYRHGDRLLFRAKVCRKTTSEG